MRSAIRDEVRRLLGDDVRAVDVLSEQDLAELRAALETARKRQAAALAAATDEALRQLPAPLRGSIHTNLSR